MGVETENLKNNDGFSVFVEGYGMLPVKDPDSGLGLNNRQRLDVLRAQALECLWHETVVQAGDFDPEYLRQLLS